MGNLFEKIEFNSRIAEKKAKIINFLLLETKSYIDKYSKYKSLKCIYAVNSFEDKGSIIKQKCNLD